MTHDLPTPRLPAATGALRRWSVRGHPVVLAAWLGLIALGQYRQHTWDPPSLLMSGVAATTATAVAAAMASRWPKVATVVPWIVIGIAGGSLPDAPWSIGRVGWAGERLLVEVPDRELHDAGTGSRWPLPPPWRLWAAAGRTALLREVTDPGGASSRWMVLDLASGVSREVSGERVVLGPRGEAVARRSGGSLLVEDARTGETLTRVWSENRLQTRPVLVSANAIISKEVLRAWGVAGDGSVFDIDGDSQLRWWAADGAVVGVAALPDGVRIGQQVGWLDGWPVVGIRGLEVGWVAIGRSGVVRESRQATLRADRWRDDISHFPPSQVVVGPSGVWTLHDDDGLDGPTRSHDVALAWTQIEIDPRGRYVAGVRDAAVEVLELPFDGTPPQRWVPVLAEQRGRMMVLWIGIPLAIWTAVRALRTVRRSRSKMSDARLSE